MPIVKHRNGIRHSVSIKEAARNLRRIGKTHREITRELNISLGSADLWTKDIILTVEQKMAIQKRRHNHKFTKREREELAKRLEPYRYKVIHSDEELIEKIKKFFLRNKRIPLKREFNALRTYSVRFGSWNNAIRRAGFSPNPILFSKKFVAQDGHNCDSFTEKILDDWLFEHDITHQRNFRYGDTKMTADFFLSPNIILEFFGLAGVQKLYDQIIERKRVFCKTNNLKLIEIYPKDIFQKNRLSEILNLIS